MNRPPAALVFPPRRPREQGRTSAVQHAGLRPDGGAGRRWRSIGALFLAAVALAALPADGQTLVTSTREMKSLNLQELLELQVMSVSRRPEKLTEVASAIQVVTGGDIRRSGATSLAEALRLAPNLRVAQVNAYATVVTARGFSYIFANKLLVLIDGRSVYTPLFAGVLWDVQNPLLEDIERIEVVSGPGGTLWGANAVNGVINVLSKPAAETRGWYATASAGSSLEHGFAVRYGGHRGSNLDYRIHFQRQQRGPARTAGGADNADGWFFNDGGWRMDWTTGGGDALTLQGGWYAGREHTLPADSNFSGGNVVAHWTRTFSADSELRVQAYHDRTLRHDIPSTLTDRLRTSDLEVQHRFPWRPGHSILWGAGVRWMRSEVTNATPFVGFVPQRRNLERYSGFLQDEITLAPDRWKLTVGTKIEHNDFSRWEVQPSVRLGWTPSPRDTMWAAVSRAVRVPSRIDVDYHLPAMEIAPGTPGVDGGPDFDAEKVIAWEAGWRTQPVASTSLSFAAFYNDYDDLFSVEAIPNTPTYHIQNGSTGESWGFESSALWQIREGWRLRGGYTYFDKDLRAKPGHTFDTTLLGNDPKHQVFAQLITDLGRGLQCDIVARYVAALPAPRLPAFVTWDLRLAWQGRNVTVALVGQNLGEPRHAEFGQVAIRRSGYAKLEWRW